MTLAAGSNDFAIYSRGGREYFLIENRRKAGRDAALPDEGLAIWHVDEDGDNSHEQMTAGSHYELSLEQADGLFQLERQRGPDRRRQRPVRRAGGALRRHHRARQQVVERHAVEPDHRPDLGGRRERSPSAACWATTSTPPQTLHRESQPNLAIPDNNPTGITDTIDVTEAQTISAIKVGVDITHPYRGDLRVTLTTPWGTVIELHPKNQRRQRRRPQGHLRRDLAPGAGHAARAQHAGCLAADGAGPGAGGHRAAEPLVAGVHVGCRPAAAAAGANCRSRPARDPRQSSRRHRARAGDSAGTAQVGSVEVTVDISHTWIGDLRVSLRSPAGHRGGAARPHRRRRDNIVRTYTAATTPALAALAGQADRRHLDAAGERPRGGRRGQAEPLEPDDPPRLKPCNPALEGRTPEYGRLWHVAPLLQMSTFHRISW